MEANLQLQDDLRRCRCILAKKRLVWGHSGNVSVRVEPSAFVISAGGSNLGILHDEDLILCRIDQDVWEDTKPPFMEMELHRCTYRACSDGYCPYW
jgi:ribulose-5-phosphate 4-epimerase/fuculose-1-phosphate aldolase